MERLINTSSLHCCNFLRLLWSVCSTRQPTSRCFEGKQLDERRARHRLPLQYHQLAVQRVTFTATDRFLQLSTAPSQCELDGCGIENEATPGWICMYVGMHVCMYVHTYIHTSIHPYIHTYIQVIATGGKCCT